MAKTGDGIVLVAKKGRLPCQKLIRELQQDAELRTVKHSPVVTL